MNERTLGRTPKTSTRPNQAAFPWETMSSSRLMLSSSQVKLKSEMALPLGSVAELAQAQRLARSVHPDQGTMALTDTTQNCTLSPRSVVGPGEVLPDDTVVYSNGLRRTDRRGMTDLRKTGLTKQLGALKRMIPSNPAKFQS